MAKINFSEKEIICELFTNGTILTEIAKIFNCSKTPIGEILIKSLGIEKYKKIAKEHLKENGQRVGKLPKTENQIKASQETGQKTVKKMNNHPNTIAIRPINGLKYGIPAMHKINAQNHNWVSKPENNFYEKILIPGFEKLGYVIKRQYHIKGLNHAFDFALPEFKILIEIDGDYWHTKEDIKKRDAEINEFIKKTDWILFRYTDTDLKKMKILS